MTHTLRIPTTEQYAYIEFQVEGTPEEAIDEYRRLTKAVTGGTGLDTREFNGVLDEYLWRNNLPVEDFEKLNIEQMEIMQAIKRSKARNTK